MYRLKHLEQAASMSKPCDYFDIIGGVGTGGVIALMLGRLRMPIDLAIEKYVEFSKKVYSDIKTFSMGSERFKASTFVSAMEDMLQSAGFPADVLMQEENPFCKSFVAALPYANMTPRIFRSYSVKANQGYNCTVVEAARATTASPQFFKAVSIGAGGLNEKFIGAHLGHNNPINFVLEEAELGLQKVALDDWNSLGEIKTHSVNYLHKAEITQKVDLIVDTLHNSLQKITLGVLTGLLLPGSFMKEISMHKLLPVVPAPSFLFTGRADVLYQLEKYFINESSSLKFNHQKHFVLYGLGGAGKTQIALQFSHTFKNRACIKYAPENFYQVGEMLDEDSLSVLLKASLRCNLSEAEHAAAKELVQELGNLALAIVQAGGYLHYHQHVKFNQYLENYKKDKPKYLRQVKTHNLDGYSLSAFATWDCSYQKLDRKAKEILMLCSVLHCSKIPVEILEKAWNNLTQYPELDTQEIKQTLELFVEDGNWDNVSLEKALDALQSYSLVEISGEGVPLLNIHSLVHVWSYKSLEPEKQKRAQLCAQQLLLCVSKEMKTYYDVVEWVPHLQQLLKLLTVDAIGIKVAYAMGQIFEAAHMWSEAEPLQRQILEIYIGKSRRNQFNPVGGMESLVITLRQGGQLQEAESHPDTIRAMKNLALTLRRVGKLEEAEKFEKQVLKAWTEAFGSSHPDTIRAMENLAKTLRKAGKLEEAEKFQQQVLKAWTEGFSRSYPDTIRAMGNLAKTLRRAGKLEEAEKFEQQVLKAQTEGFGSSHPDTIRAMENLAWILRTAGRLEEAEKFQQQVLNARTEGFGSHHPHTIKAMENLALTLRRAGRLEEAENFQLQVLKAWTEEFGSSHPDTIRAMENLALTLGRAGRLEEAEKFQQQALKAWKEGFSSSHPDTIRAMENLAWTLRRAGKLEEAKKLQQALKFQTQRFGSRHPDIIRAIGNLARTLLFKSHLQLFKNN
ncbi:hypothetical protein C0989_003993 [Termitomyces sp. Mn162]|nr:hypothetical protein C0989_003993 [Termitomyces sp. Mn162]